mmetsp:Transcript_4381/g.6156  ORF Transcript_4381/g.6156 Transcript_4381/m.6156 type:complete len:96 (+) Transcript_4381:94-381(+)|eukprot:CAMPEP_0184748490 /NCGR_PEP_ID=MMETSP0315-20130426/19772_1 /TAXON_ID=101924 /ORGANISM="Rhodosorus marinus, Strain UTEX LB 2760" /LENGTH=95 /DNA_ID=CAMNT_0027223799 /DNA_START=83 /DNA_END=370 /DNA_ORIENTATION=-
MAWRTVVFVIFTLLVITRAKVSVLREGDFGEALRQGSADRDMQLDFVGREDSPLAALLANENDKYALAEEAERAGEEFRSIVNLPKSEDDPEAEA